MLPAAALILLLAGALWAAGAPGDPFPTMRGRAAEARVRRIGPLGDFLLIYRKLEASAELFAAKFRQGVERLARLPATR